MKNDWKTQGMGNTVIMILSMKKDDKNGFICCKAKESVNRMNNYLQQKVGKSEEKNKTEIGDIKKEERDCKEWINNLRKKQILRKTLNPMMLKCQNKLSLDDIVSQKTFNRLIASCVYQPRMTDLTAQMESSLFLKKHLGTRLAFFS